MGSHCLAGDIWGPPPPPRSLRRAGRWAPLLDACAVRGAAPLTHAQYMVVLGLLFLVQFGVSCSCLAMDRGRQVGGGAI